MPFAITMSVVHVLQVRGTSRLLFYCVHCDIPCCWCTSVYKQDKCRVTQWSMVLICLCSCRILFKPITTPCGHMYCESCITCNLDYTNTCPMCRHDLGAFCASLPQVRTRPCRFHAVTLEKITEILACSHFDSTC